MIQTTRYYDMASLSEATYVDFSGINFLDIDKIRASLQKAGDRGGNFSATQAQIFVDKWEIVSHQANTETGFSATLFRDIDSGEYYYSTRGTEPGAQGAIDLLEADIGDIVNDGLAIKQIVDMYNDVQRITAGENMIYQAAKLEELSDETTFLHDGVSTMPIWEYNAKLQALMARDDIIIDSGTVYTIVMKNSDEIYSYTDERAYGLGILLDANNANVAGHSLGGHLAAAFTRLFPGSEATTINGAGFMTGDIEGLSGSAGLNIRNLFGMLGGANQFDSSKIHNLYGEKGVELTTMDSEFGLVQQGGNEGIYIETTMGSSIDEILSNLLGHGGSQMTDSLAVFDLFVRMDTRFQTTDAVVAAVGGEELMDIFLSMETGRQVSQTFENMVDALGEIFVTNYFPIDHTVPDDEKREEFYSKISQIQNVIEGKSLTVTSLVTSIEAIKTQALQDNETGLATRYALTRLNPFTITGDPNLYDKFNATGQIDLYSETNPDGDLSAKYIEDRSKFLYYLTRPDEKLPEGESTIQFTDERLGIKTLAWKSGTGVDTTVRDYFWGTEGSDTFGSILNTGNDHLYGMGGDDTLKGYGGVDHIEGGDGRDTLDGGTGEDILVGGKGFDTYIWRPGDGNDTIVEYREEDGVKRGFIWIKKDEGDDTAAGYYKKAEGQDNVWTHETTYGGILTLTHGEEWTLTMEDGVSVLKLGTDFKSGDLGIRLEEGDYDHTLIGSADDDESDYYPDYDLGTYTYRLGNNTDFTGDMSTSQSLEIYGGAGNDTIRGLRWHDYLNGGAGDDIIISNTNDIMEPDISGDVMDGGEGIVKKGVENTIANIGRLGREGMRETDKEIIRMMLGE